VDALALSILGGTTDAKICLVVYCGIVPVIATAVTYLLTLNIDNP